MHIFIRTLIHSSILFFIWTATAFSEESQKSLDIYSGHYAREGNGESATAAITNNIYIKFFNNQWIALMYIPLPYANTLEQASITRALEEAKSQTTHSAYLRSKFGQFSELATVHIEKYKYLDDRLVFECGSLAPCTIQIEDGHLKLIKPGVINEHIIRYNHVFSK